MGVVLSQTHPPYFMKELISRLMASRGDGQPDIDDINDFRNGLLLVKALQTVFGLGQVAFWKVALTIIEQEC